MYNHCQNISEVSLIRDLAETPELPLWLQIIMRDGRFRTFCGRPRMRTIPKSTKMYKRGQKSDKSLIIFPLIIQHNLINIPTSSPLPLQSLHRVPSSVHQ